MLIPSFGCTGLKTCKLALALLNLVTEMWLKPQAPWDSCKGVEKCLISDLDECNWSYLGQRTQAQSGGISQTTEAC